MTLETTNVRYSGPLVTRPWSKRFTVFMLLVVGTTSPVVGGAAAWLALLPLSASGSADEAQSKQVCLSAALAALLTGLFFWWLFILRPRRITPGRGAWVGVVGSAAAHPLTWLFASRLSILLGGSGFLFRIPAKFSSPADVLVYVALISFYSLILAGWFTELLGGLAGAGVAWALARLAKRDQQRIEAGAPG